MLDLKGAGIDSDQTEVINDLVGQSVARREEIKVITSRDVKRIAELEASKQMLGCDEASCLAELAGDFGAKFVLYGSIGKFAELYVIQLTLFDAEAAEAVKRGRVETRDLSNVTKSIDDVVDDVLGRKTAATTVEPFELPLAETLSIGGASLAALGVVLVIIGVQPALAYGDAQAKIASEQEKFPGGEADLVEAARQQALAATAAEQWDAYGALTTTSGVIISVAGVAASTVGVLMWSGVLGGTE